VPELPDVEGFRRYLARYAAGRRIERVEVRDRELVRNASPRALGSALEGETLGEPRRHGKWMLAPAGDAVLAVHFGMTGLLHWTARPGEPHRHDRLVLHCNGGELAYRDMRRFGGVWLSREPDGGDVIGALGPDALGVDADRFEELLGHRRGGVKAALMDQTVIAGLGNLLVDEILWRARVNPRAPIGRLRRSTRRRIHREMEATLHESIPTARVPSKSGWLTAVRDHRDARCPRCGGPLRRGTVAGRTTCWCPRCQR
jgi:formamidopyrimidine-DNA glycosylase